MGLAALIVGAAAFVIASIINLLVTRIWFVKICGLIGAGAGAVFLKFFDPIGIEPDESDLTTLSLSDYSVGQSRSNQRSHDPGPQG